MTKSSARVKHLSTMVAIAAVVLTAAAVPVALLQVARPGLAAGEQAGSYTCMLVEISIDPLHKDEPNQVPNMVQGKQQGWSQWRVVKDQLNRREYLSALNQVVQNTDLSVKYQPPPASLKSGDSLQLTITGRAVITKTDSVRAELRGYYEAEGIQVRQLSRTPQGNLAEAPAVGGTSSKYVASAQGTYLFTLPTDSQASRVSIREIGSLRGGNGTVTEYKYTCGTGSGGGGTPLAVSSGSVLAVTGECTARSEEPGALYCAASSANKQANAVIEYEWSVDGQVRTGEKGSTPKFSGISRGRHVISVVSQDVADPNRPVRSAPFAVTVDVDPGSDTDALPAVPPVAPPTSSGTTPIEATTSSGTAMLFLLGALGLGVLVFGVVSLAGRQAVGSRRTQALPRAPARRQAPSMAPVRAPFDMAEIPEPHQPGDGAWARLVVTSGRASQPYVDVPVSGLAIGRDKNNDLVLVDTAASRRHAYIRWENGAWMVFDAASRNGTFVNGERVSSQILGPGDQIQMGATSLQFQC